MKICSVEGCEKPTKGGYGKFCGMHKTRMERYGNPYTNKYATRISRQGNCHIEGCERPVAQNGLCYMHEARRRTGGDIANPNPVRAANRTGYINSEGYRRFTIGANTYVYEHIILAEKALGKKLPPGAEVHHMNGQRADNFTPFNLVVCPNRAYHKLLEKRARELGFAEYFRSERP